MLLCKEKRDRWLSLRFQLNPKPIGEPIDIIKIRCHLYDIMKRVIIKTRVAQPVDILARDRRRLTSQPIGKGEHELICLFDISLEVIAEQVGLKRIIDATEGPQRGPVMFGSVVTAVDSRHHHRDHFPLVAA